MNLQEIVKIIKEKQISAKEIAKITNIPLCRITYLIKMGSLKDQKYAEQMGKSLKLSASRKKRVEEYVLNKENKEIDERI